MNYYYVRYSICGRKVINMEKHTNSSGFLEERLKCDHFVSGSLNNLAEYKIKSDPILGRPALVKISLVCWRFTRYAADIKAATHIKLERVLAFKIFKG